MNIPKLRFKEFNDEWIKIDLSTCFEYFSTNSLSREQLSDHGIIKNIHYGDVHKKYGNVVDVENDVAIYIKDAEQINKYEFCCENDIIFADASEDYDGIGKAIELINVNEKLVSGLHTIHARDKKQFFSPLFKGYYFNTPIIHNQIRILANGFKVFGISRDNINNLKVMLPSKQEQEKIAKLLSLLDKKIQLQTKKIEALKLFKSYTKSEIFKNGNHVCKLGVILNKWNKKNKDGAINYVESISNKAGFIPQSEQFEDRNVASKNLRNYYVIKKGVFGYNPSRLNVGSLALKENDFISVVSPLYECFTTTQNNTYLFEWFNSNNFKKETFSKFEGGVRNTLNFNNLCDIPINLPDIETQNQYAKYFNKINFKISLEEQKLSELVKFKKGLLQDMFI